MKNEKLLVQQLKIGDQNAFRALYNAYSDKIYFTAKRFNCSTQEAEGLVQEVFMKIWENRSQIKEDLSFKSFISTTAKNMVINQLKRKTYDITCKVYFKKFSQHFENSTEDYIIFTDLKAKADQFIDTLPQKRKQILLLRRKENLSSKEIAEQMGISQRTVENNIYKADLALKTFLGKENFKSWMLLMFFSFFF